MPPLTRSRAWRALAAHRKKLARARIADLFTRDARRFDRFSLRLDGLLLDYSKNLLTADTVRLLVALARERGVAAAARRMFGGRKVNASEERAALHTALRGERPVKVNGADVMPLVRETLARMRAFCGEVRGSSRITDVVSLGIGGSHLGPALVTQALAQYADGSRVHFVASVDGAALARTLKPLDPAATLAIVVSKTFTTVETLTNARAVRGWLGARASDPRLVAVTANAKLALDFGIAKERIYPFWDWVGGRYSLWSAVGLPAALAVGMDNFDALLRGARAMDEHFRAAPAARNLPVMLALIGIWHNNFWGAATHAVLPYDASLALLPAYLQQLDMESSGKRNAADGKAVDCDTGAVVWGAPGTEAQHSFFQLLHQGTRLIPADFIAACRSPAANGSHAILMANFFAQTAALMNGAPDEGFPGNRPSNSILLDELTPHALGMLLALYEHKVFVQNAIWGVNPFDQPGVELGKRLAARLQPELEGRIAATSRDASTDGLIAYYKSNISQKPGGKA